ncbi:phage tail tape measure protein [Cucumibacter marinus]|uniref:phage tail tape measure protein n=1 Tax=Cucumibacter marinus TaxID=1121252 RepID=UPI000688CE9D|nr:phage tail tape measure protein [Cucumibacter marinus]
MSSTLMSSLVVQLIDRVTGPAQKVTSAVNRMNAAGGQRGPNFAERMAMSQARIGNAIDQNNRALNASRGRLIDAVGGYYILDRTIGNTIRTTADFETALNRVSAVSGASDEELAKLSDQAQELGRTTAFRASQVAGAMEYLSMAGFKANDIMEALPATLNLASAAQLDLGQSADIVSNILTGYNKDVSELGGVTDVLVKAFTSANTDLNQLGEAMKYAGPMASAAGVDFETAAAALSLMGNAGIQASMAGTSLRGAITRMLNPTAKVQAAMDQIGLNFTDAEGSLLPLDQIIQQLEPHSDDAGLMMELFGQRAGPAMTALVTQGSDALRDLTTELENSGGTAAEIAAKQLEGLNGSLIKLASAVEGIQIAIGETLVPAVTAMAEAITSMTGPITELISKHPTLTRAIVGTAAAMVSLKVAAAALTFAGLIGKGGALSLLRVGFKGVGLAAMPVAGYFETLAMRSAMVTKATGRQPGIFARLGDALLVLGRSPLSAVRNLLPVISRLGFIGAAVGMAATWIVNNWSGLVTFFQSFSTAFTTAMEPVWPVLDQLGIAFGETFKGLMPIIQPVLDGINGLWNAITGLLGPVDESGESWRSWGTTLGTGVAAQVISLTNAIQSMARWLENAWKWATDLVNALAQIGGDAWNATTGAVGGAWNAAGDAWNSFMGGGDQGKSHRAHGGPVFPGRSFLVGENEPEVFTPGSVGRITPVSQLGGQGISIGDIHVHGSTDPVATARAVRDELVNELEAAVRGLFDDAGARA